MKQLSVQLTVRKATANDAELYYNWVNDSVVRASAFNNEPISWESHESWFNNKLNDFNSWLYVVSIDNKTPIGQVRFEIEDMNAKLDYSIDQSHRGKGWSAALLKVAISQLFKDCKTVKTIIAQVRPANKVSSHVLSKIGFSQGDTIDDSIIMLVLNKTISGKLWK